MTANGFGTSFGEDEKCSKIDRGDECTPQKNLTIHFNV